MTDFLFRNLISSYANSGEVLALRQQVPRGQYVAVQLRNSSFSPQLWASALDAIHRLYHLTTVFFLAGCPRYSAL